MKKLFYTISLIAILAAIVVSCKNDVKKGQVASMTFDEESFTIEEGASIDLDDHLTILPKEVADTLETLTWASDKKDNVTVGDHSLARRRKFVRV